MHNVAKINLHFPINREYPFAVDIMIVCCEFLKKKKRFVHYISVTRPKYTNVLVKYLFKAHKIPEGLKINNNCIRML